MTTRTSLPQGLLVVSVVFDTQEPGLTGRHQRSIARASQELFYLLKQYDVPASFAVPDPACSHLTDAVLRCGSHELALQLANSWSSHETTRRRFTDELAGRIQRAAAEGLDVRTVIGGHGVLLRYPDALSQQRIVACVAPPSGLTVYPRARGPFPVRPRLWYFPISVSWPDRSRWLTAPSVRTIRRALHEAAHQKSVLHLSLNLPAMVVQTAVPMASRLRTLAGLLSLVQELTRQRQLAIGTLANAAQQLTESLSAVPARSILAKAA